MSGPLVDDEFAVLPDEDYVNATNAGLIEQQERICEITEWEINLDKDYVGLLHRRTEFFCPFRSQFHGVSHGKSVTQRWYVFSLAHLIFGSYLKQRIFSR